MLSYFVSRLYSSPLAIPLGASRCQPLLMLVPRRSVSVLLFMSPCHVLHLLFRSWRLWDSADQCPSEHGGGSVSYWSCQLSWLHLSAGSATKACCRQGEAGKGCWQLCQGMSICSQNKSAPASAVNSVKKASAQQQIWESALLSCVSCTHFDADCHQVTLLVRHPTSQNDLFAALTGSSAIM
jgi:hypothetical protein